MSDGIDEQSPEVAAMAEPWPVIDALVGGTLAMRKAGKKFLPKFPQEDGGSYGDRLSSAVLFPAFTRTAEVLAARPLSRPIKVDGVSDSLKANFTNIDMLGTDLHAFCGQIMLACLRHGIHGVLVDSPKAEGIRTVADAKKAGIRPYFAHYPCASILGWEFARSASGVCLTQLRLKETVTEPKSRFEKEAVDQIRVFEPGKWEVWRQPKTADGSKAAWQIHDAGVTSINAIPFQFFYGLREGFGIGRPPLLELAHMNVEHWQSSSDQQNILHVARVPLLFAKGFSGTDKIIIGANAATFAKDAGAELKFVEHSGEAIESGRKSIHDLEDRMRQTGAELLTERQGEVTASQVNSEDEDNRSTLQKIVEEFEDSLESCFRLMGLWLGEKANPTVELHKDFGKPGSVQPQT